ncbi:MAG TPA: 4,5-DOPA dioxygenase extradiol [Bdellovibrionales bacterium]|nr:4,5-DOPA dioxygenase extradiol [Bdellovibrionales bacterium]
MKRAPVFFIGHGSPMNALETNDFTRALAGMRALYPAPKAILCISAHWMTEGTWVTHMPKPKTIHDFYGFPQALFDIQYPAPGSPETAKLVSASVSDPRVNLDNEMWGLDHGTWTVLRHVFPEADVPVVQLSLYMAQPPEYHLKVGQQLRALRDRGVLIVGSGNIVHNLRRIDWNTHAKPFDWAIEFDAVVKASLERRDAKALMSDFHSSEAGKLSVPTNDHYYPLLYAFGAADERDELRFVFEEIHNASISMRTLSFGAG